MPRRERSHLLTDELLRAALAARAERLRIAEARSTLEASSRFSAGLAETTTPAAPFTLDSPLPLIEPMWSFWLDAADLADMTTAFAGRQIDAPARGGSRRIPKIDLPAAVIASLKTWFDDHSDGVRAKARAANYLAHYGLRLPGTRGLKPSRFLDAFHATLLGALRHRLAAGAFSASELLFQLRRLHLELARTASLIVEGVPTSEVFARLRDSLLLGRTDMLTAQWLLARPEVAAALRSHILVPYSEPWMAPLDRLRQLTDTIDSLSLFYLDLAMTSEALLLSIRFGDWTQSSPTAATQWATFWHDEIARYLVAFEEVTGLRLAR